MVCDFLVSPYQYFLHFKSWSDYISRLPCLIYFLGLASIKSLQGRSMGIEKLYEDT